MASISIFNAGRAKAESAMFAAANTAENPWRQLAQQALGAAIERW